MRAAAPALAALVLALSASVARADRPTSSDMSITSGRTLGVGELVLAAGLGWPGIWAEAVTAPSSTFNLGFRGTVLYGTPLIGFGGGVGGELSVPMRLHLFGAGQLDLALGVTPAFVIGEASLVGQEGTFANDLGFAARGEVAMLAGAQVSAAVTITLGLGGGVAWTSAPDAGGASDIVGTALAILAIEALMARDTLLFAEAAGGYGFAPEMQYDGRGVMRVSLGMAYLM